MAAGYLDRSPDGTARFFTTPAGEHGYRTGDLARLRPDGDLEMLGRIDDQLKIHGHRVEPAEIEAVLTSDSSIAEAAVVAATGADGALALSAFLVPAAIAETDSLAERARALCERHLPFYARPDHLHLVNELPLTSSGKVDRRALAAFPAPTPLSNGPSLEHGDPVMNDLARLWGDILGELPHSSETNFFTSGGDSLKAVLFAGAARRAGLQLTVHDVLHHRTLGRIAGAATGLRARVDASPVADGPVPLSAVQRAVLTTRPVHEVWTLWYLSVAPYRDIDPIRLQQAFDVVVRRHPALRSAFDRSTSGWSARLAPFAARGLHLLDLSGHPAGDHDELVDRRLAEREDLFDLAGPLVDLVLIGGAGPPQIAWIVHHLLADLVSLQILTHELWDAYDHPDAQLAPADDGYIHWLG